MAVTKGSLVSVPDSGGINAMRQDKVFQKRTLIVHELGAIANNDVVLLMKIPVEAKIPSIKFASDDLGTTGLLNIGFYKADGSIIAADTDAVDEDCIGTLIDVKAGAVALTEIRFETKGIETLNQKAWEIAGLSARPTYADFYLAITAAEAVDVGGTIILDVQHLD